jgi:hypothetical protein
MVGFPLEEEGDGERLGLRVVEGVADDEGRDVMEEWDDRVAPSPSDGEPEEVVEGVVPGDTVAGTDGVARELPVPPSLEEADTVELCVALEHIELEGLGVAQGVGELLAVPETLRLGVEVPLVLVVLEGDAEEQLDDDTVEDPQVVALGLGE